jgi:hypothetical protein
MERCATSKDPVILAAAIQFITVPAAVTTFGQVLLQVAEMFAIGKFPRPGHGKDISIVLLSDGTHRRVGGKFRIGDAPNLSRPGWRDKGLALST